MALHPPGVGIDFVEPSRLKARLSNDPSLETDMFTPRESEYCRRQADPSQHLAARWCAKEAVVKALGMDGWDPLDVEVVKGGADVGVELHGEVRSWADTLGLEVSISLTHLPMIAGAVALAREVR